MWTTLYLFFFCPCNRGDLISVTVPLSIVTFLLFGVRVLQWLFCGPHLWCVMVYSTLCSTVVSKIHKKNKLCVFCMIFFFFFSQVMNSVSCGKRHNANFLTIFIYFFVLQSLGQERGQRFCKDQGRWLWLLFACKFSNSHHQFLYVTVIN